MNRSLEMIFARRSIRAYRDEPIQDSTLHDILEAAMAAPSAVAKDPWHFIVIKDKKTLAAVSQGLPNGKMLATAGAGIIVCGDIDKAHDGSLSYMLQDCSAATMNILLSASALGLGGCWLGIHPREERIEHLRKLFGFPSNIIPVCAIALGVPAEEREPRTRYRDDAVHVDKW
ncbi:MAG: nitroreductase family protein [Lentisphaerae bacterium]|nr:nitroreductase family protein [Lentisphaerota bacterium]